MDSATHIVHTHGTYTCRYPSTGEHFSEVTLFEPFSLSPNLMVMQISIAVCFFLVNLLEDLVVKFSIALIFTLKSISVFRCAVQRLSSLPCAIPASTYAGTH